MKKYVNLYIVCIITLFLLACVFSCDKTETESKVEKVVEEKTQTSNQQNSELMSEKEQKKNAPTSQKSLPQFVDLGAHKCIPCIMMKPILDELKKEYDGIVDVIFIDVWKNRSAAKEYNIRVIPTQIFFDADGNEVFRHEGFFPKEDILKVFKENLNINIKKENNSNDG